MNALPSPAGPGTALAPHGSQNWLAFTLAGDLRSDQ